MNISQLFPIERLQELVADGLISETKHPEEDLFIYNYTPKCQFAGAWNKVTLQCRGLILDQEYNVIARPFPKFFNIEERSRSDIIWKRPFQLFEKVDGSLGILFPVGDEWAIATRGSFSSDQAIHATEIWKHRYTEVFQAPTGYTCLFEIIYPGNRIVVNYGDLDDLVFLGAVHIETGANLFDCGWPGRSVARYGADDVHPRDIKEKMPLDDKEGYVLYFPHANERVKVKFDEYVRLHRIVTGVSSKTVWEYLMEDRPLDELIRDVPDEFYSWVRKMANSLQEDYDSIWDVALEDYTDLLDEMDPDQPNLYQEEHCRKHRKEFARKAYTTKYPALLFKMLDHKSIVEDIWKLVRPQYERPFATDLDT